MIALLAPLVVQVVAPGFAPPLDRALAYSVREVREDGTRTQRFAIDRHVTFRRTADGFRAEVETLAVTGEAGRAGQLFEAMARRALGKHIVLLLDRDGKVVDVADFDAVWDEHLAATAEAFNGRNASRSAIVDALLAPIRALPRAAKVARLGEMIAPLIADRSITPGPQRTITLPARGPDGQPALLAGTEQVTRDGNRLMLERRAGGAVAGTATSVSVRRRIDPALGLVVETVNVETIETGQSRLIVTRSTSLTL